MSILNPNLNKQGGFIKLVILIFIAALVLGYFGINIKSEVEKPTTQENIGYVVSLGKTVWNDYLSKPLVYFWNNIFLGILWTAFMENFDLIKQGKPPVNFEATDLNTLPAYNPQ